MRSKSFQFAVVAALASCGYVASAQVGCGKDGYRVVARRWDAVLRMGWEVRQDCAHPGWPARSVALAADGTTGPMEVARVSLTRADAPLLVHAGDRVRLWQRDAMVRIETSGVAEQSARKGERVTVRVTRQTEDAGLTTQDVAGVVRGAGDVEIER